MSNCNERKVHLYYHTDQYNGRSETTTACRCDEYPYNYASTTKNPHEVTCLNCRGTKVFQQAIEAWSPEAEHMIDTKPLCVSMQRSELRAGDVSIEIEEKQIRVFLPKESSSEDVPDISRALSKQEIEVLIKGLQRALSLVDGC